MADGRPRITVTSARTATASLAERRGEGVDRRAAHQEPLAGERLAREVTERRVERRVEPPPPPVEAAVETVSAAEVLANVAEYGPNYVLPQAAESKDGAAENLSARVTVAHGAPDFVRGSRSRHGHQPRPARDFFAPWSIHLVH